MVKTKNVVVVPGPVVGLAMETKVVQWLFNGLRLRLPLCRDADIDRHFHILAFLAFSRVHEHLELSLREVHHLLARLLFVLPSGFSLVLAWSAWREFHGKPAHVIPRVEYAQEGRSVVICPKHGVLSFEPDTPEWFAWVAQQSSFRFVGKEGHFTAHHEWTTSRGAWRAHREIRNHSYNLPLAPNQHLTIAVLEQAAHSLHAHLT